MSDSMSCVSCEFLQVQTFKSSLAPSTTTPSNAVPEDQEPEDSPNTRYILQSFYIKLSQKAKTSKLRTSNKKSIVGF